MAPSPPVSYSVIKYRAPVHHSCHPLLEVEGAGAWREDSGFWLWLWRGLLALELLSRHLYRCLDPHPRPRRRELELGPLSCVRVEGLGFGV